MFRDPSEDMALYRVETWSTQRAVGVSLWLHGSSSNDVAFRTHCLHLQGEARKGAVLGNCSPIGSEQHCRQSLPSPMWPTRRSDTPYLSLSLHTTSASTWTRSVTLKTETSSETSEHLTITCCRNPKEGHIVLCLCLFSVCISSELSEQKAAH